MYKWIFISTCRFYSGFKNEAPRFSAAAVVTVSQFTIAMLLLTLMKRAGVWDFTMYIPGKPVAIAGYVYLDGYCL